ATTRATQFARGCGDEDLTELVASGEVPQESLLSRSTDITSSLLVCPKHFGPQKPPSTTAVQKAAIMSFQTWAIRAPGIVGLMLGNKTPKRKNGLIIVVARGYDELIGSSAISTLCTQEAMFPCGVVMQGEESKEDDRTTAVHPTYPGAIATLERRLESNDLIAVSPTWGYSRATRVGNITWLHNLGKSNEERMYINVVKTVVHQVKDALNTPDCEPAAGNNKIG
ncbi:unnamed protein product, partial [Durusdinium trenchii]